MKYYDYIYSYISYLWKESKLSKRKFAINHNIEESTLRDIIKGENYQISLPTIYKICESRDMKLSDFFIEVEKWKESVKK
ncbi:helix-turn-helix domain-containing protein [Flavivirga eckloniae]|uniref:Transcriptional regulator n=1 Tax=Flavivirga eckloniae TaxID=1803846 RepID=A0A2K9PRU0_9FLAO|nr:transcriptional regulator [Flavivirga eckloniae]